MTSTRSHQVAGAGPRMRPYAVARGRTRLPEWAQQISIVAATGTVPAGLDPEYREILGLCREPVPVVEVCALSRQPVTVTRMLVSDLVSWGALNVRTPVPVPAFTNGRPSLSLLEAVIDGLRAI